MANLLFSAQISEQALSQDTVETLIQLSAPANQRVKLVRWGVFLMALSREMSRFKYA